jgi:hypothetical protein
MRKRCPWRIAYRPRIAPTMVPMFVASLVAAGPVSAIVCTGDCDGKDTVTVDELVIGIAVTLGQRILDDCPSFDSDQNEQVTVNELARAVADALYGCGVAPPTATLTPTATGTPTPTATRTQTPIVISTETPSPTITSTAEPTFPDVGGQWREDEGHISPGTTCTSQLVDLAVSELLEEPFCDYSVSQNGANVTATDCDQVSATGSVDAQGLMTFVVGPLQDTVEDCTISQDVTVAIDAGHSPTTARHTIAFSFTGVCPFENCTILIESRWTKQ